MSDDLVKRLRVQANRRSGCAHMMSDGSIKWHPMLDEAADEIERLRAELAAACELLHKLTAIIPGNDTAGEEVAEFLTRTKGGGDE